MGWTSTKYEQNNCFYRNDAELTEKDKTTNE